MAQQYWVLVVNPDESVGTVVLNSLSEFPQHLLEEDDLTGGYVRDALVAAPNEGMGPYDYEPTTEVMQIAEMNSMLYPKHLMEKEVAMLREFAERLEERDRIEGVRGTTLRTSSFEECSLETPHLRRQFRASLGVLALVAVGLVVWIVGIEGKGWWLGLYAACVVAVCATVFAYLYRRLIRISYPIRRPTP